MPIGATPPIWEIFIMALLLRGIGHLSLPAILQRLCRTSQNMSHRCVLTAYNTNR
jgi:hypothetical protein